MNIITQLILFCMAIIGIPAVIIVFIQWLVDGEITCYDDDDTPSDRSDTGSYTHKDLYGHISGFSNVSDNSSDHYSSNGYSASYRSGNDTYHYGTDGYHGRSHKSDSGEITHYGKDNMPSGYSRPNGHGGYDHFDKWGLPVGRSDKD